MKKTILPVILFLLPGILSTTAAERQSFDDNWQSAFGDASDPDKDFG